MVGGGEGGPGGRRALRPGQPRTRAGRACPGGCSRPRAQRWTPVLCAGCCSMKDDSLGLRLPSGGGNRDRICLPAEQVKTRIERAWVRTAEDGLRGARCLRTRPTHRGWAVRPEKLTTWCQSPRRGTQELVRASVPLPPRSDENHEPMCPEVSINPRHRKRRGDSREGVQRDENSAAATGHAEARAGETPTSDGDSPAASDSSLSPTHQ